MLLGIYLTVAAIIAVLDLKVHHASRTGKVHYKGYEGKYLTYNKFQIFRSVILWAAIWPLFVILVISVLWSDSE